MSPDTTSPTHCCRCRGYTQGRARARLPWASLPCTFGAKFQIDGCGSSTRAWFWLARLGALAPKGRASPSRVFAAQGGSVLFCKRLAASRGDSCRHWPGFRPLSGNRPIAMRTPAGARDGRRRRPCGGFGDSLRVSTISSLQSASPWESNRTHAGLVRPSGRSTPVCSWFSVSGVTMPASVTR